MSAADVARLFVALPVPLEVAEALAGLQPAPGRSVRLSDPADFHVTLRFLGRATVNPVREALAAIAADAFGLRLTGPGRFDVSGGRSVLVIGVEPTPPLRSLHAAVAAALAPLGFEPESRPFSPHVTLARLGPGAPADRPERFGEQVLPSAASRFRCERFALYASEPVPDGARYRVVAGFPLSAAEPANES